MTLSARPTLVFTSVIKLFIRNLAFRAYNICSMSEKSAKLCEVKMKCNNKGHEDNNDIYYFTTSNINFEQVFA